MPLWCPPQNQSEIVSKLPREPDSSSVHLSFHFQTLPHSLISLSVYASLATHLQLPPLRSKTWEPNLCGDEKKKKKKRLFTWDHS